MKKLFSMILVAGLLFSGNAYAEYYELNKCFIKSEWGNIISNSWETSNIDKIASYAKPSDIEAERAENSKNIQPDEDGIIWYPTSSLVKIIYEGPIFDDYIFSIDTTQSTVTELRIYNDEWNNARNEYRLDFCKKNPTECERTYKTKHPSRPEKYKKYIFNITNIAGGIITAKRIPEWGHGNFWYILNINLNNNEINYRSYEDKHSTTNTDDIYSCNKGDSDSDKTGTSSGTAFFINNRGNLITNNHVVEGCKLSKINYFNKEYDTSLISTDKTLDLALLKVDLEPRDFISFSNKEPKKRQLVIVAGYPLGQFLSDDLKINEGKVSSLKGFENNSNEITVDLAINPGNSGGPIVNENGQLVAVAVAGMSKEVTEGISFGIKSSAVTSFLKTNKISSDIKLTSFSMNDEKVNQLLEESTVYIFCEQ